MTKHKGGILIRELESLGQVVRRHPIILTGLFTILLAINTGFALTAQKARKVVNGEIGQAQKVQKQFQQWEQEKAVLLSDIRDARVRSLWLSFQQEKYRNYLERQQQVIDELKQKKIAAKRIRMELEPFLEQLVSTLETNIAADLPFLQEERKARVSFLKESLSDYHIDLSEKLRRILEALRIEAEYGKTVERTEEILSFNGAPTKVVIIRIGRIGLYYRSLEGKHIGRWDQEARTWIALPAAYSTILADASEMASGKRAVELLNLPLGKLPVE